VIATPQISESDQHQITRLLSDEELNFDELMAQGDKIIDRNGPILTNLAALLRALNRVLKTEELTSVVVDMPADILKQKVLLAERLYLSAFQLQLRGNSGDTGLDHLILMDVGPALYMYAVEPQNFKNATLDGLEMSTLNSRPGISNNNEDAYAEAKDKLSTSRISLRELVRQRQLLRSGHYSGLSDSEVIERVTDRFWRPAHSAVKTWLRAELASKEKPKSKDDRLEMDQLMAKSGKILIFAREENFARLKEGFKKTCN
jgi:hypothetical protein